MSWLAFAALAFVALTLAALVVGIVVFARGGAANRRHGNSLMRLRVAFQFAVLALLGLLFLTAG